ncbi:MAG: chemotaxis protein [Lachnospiraceae bacterium]|nr:chemotaxis protein [Lachnospiraceae bacterium]
MNDTKRQTGRKKLVAILLSAFLVLVVWQIAVLKLLEKGVISTFWAMLLISAGVLALAVFFGIILKFIFDIFRQIVGGQQPSAQTESKGKKLAERNDEIGEMVRYVQGIVSSFAQLVVAIRQASDELENLSGDLQSIFGNMSSAVEQSGNAVSSITANTVSQAGQTTDMKNKIDAISESIGGITQNVEILTKSAELMKEYDVSVEQIMKELVDISDKSSQAIEDVRKQTELTNQSAQQIRTATEIIAGISSKTNLLALNASIEAARAGEHGKGFAVVAEEIRALADQSRESTEQIGKVVANLLGNSDVSVEITKKVSEAFLRQNEKIQDTENIFNLLNQEIGKVSDSIHGIADEVEELSGHREVIENSITALANCADENADSAQQTAENMEEFRQIADECQNATNNMIKISEKLVGYIKEVSSVKDYIKV